MNSWKLLSSLILILALASVGAFPQEIEDIVDENDEKRDISLVDETERSLTDDLVDDAVKETVRDILKITGKDDPANVIIQHRRRSRRGKPSIKIRDKRRRSRKKRPKKKRLRKKRPRKKRPRKKRPRKKRPKKTKPEKEKSEKDKSKSDTLLLAHTLVDGVVTIIPHIINAANGQPPNSDY